MSDEQTTRISQATELFDGSQPQPTQTIEDRLRALRAKREGVNYVDLDVPGYDGLLFARYQRLDGKRLTAIAKRVQKQVKDEDERGIVAAIDTLLAGCVEFGVREGDEEKLLSEVVEQDSPVRYDMRLAEFLGFAAKLSGIRGDSAARAIAREVFLGNEVAIAGHNSAYSQWMLTNGDSNDSGDGLGEA